MMRRMDQKLMTKVRGVFSCFDFLWIFVHFCAMVLWFATATLCVAALMILLCGSATPLVMLYD